MCGIVGLFDTRGRREIDRRLLWRMNQLQIHRGPDEGELHTEPGVGLGHRRLSIMDVSSGQQPLFNADGTVVVVFNGEIYNFQALTAELVARGYTFRTHCDTEVIVYAWEEWGERCVDHFRGMFAFGLWDRNRETLFLARDRLGIKPLYYALLDDGMLAFASELKALLAHPGLARTMDPRAIEDYFAYGYVPEPKTIFREAFKLSPGHTLRLSTGRDVPQPQRYWDVPFVPHDPMSLEAAQEGLIARLSESVGLHLMTEVPLGAFLSGGVDSSAVVAMMANLMDEPVNTCSISFGNPAFNESEYARMVAERYHTRHDVEQVEPDDFDLVDRLATLYDEPFADSSAMPTYRVCELARKRVTVALSGDGGDENLAGYRRYRWHLYEERLRSMLPLGLRRPLFGLLGGLYPKADWAPKVLRAKSTFEALARDSVEGYFHGVSIMKDAMRRRLFSGDFSRSLEGYRAVEVLREHAGRCPVDDPLSRVQYLDMKTYLVGDILTKVDRASMAHALEVRVPLLDHELVEWISGLPVSFKLQGHQGKYVFKKGLEPYLPDEVLYRSKMGFSVPLAEWFRGPLRQRIEEALLGPVLAETGIFDRAFLGELLAQHQSGRRDHSAPLWSLLMFESFLRNVLSVDHARLPTSGQPYEERAVARAASVSAYH
ncbi:XrtA/PEP-CTERM system amidotransferase [Nitrosovibrio sp. Nv17]|uniref:XrtA/PEP-CTERM system amidotransferase n=1 Tax=Nitrosovibrio sp. Nv17 TaxID=1855339 RepID=UPI000908C6D7|nr:XrtA/PEP-CTERM system amidotransferase [Nitrosovibrio sp. Nv17]SFW20255.1 asparagine synthase (glutamine-hydrolysing) [Nitrosovibrio sp. Nv17]